MIVSSGHILAIDRVQHDSTITGDGATTPVGIASEWTEKINTKTDWNESDPDSLAYIDNHPVPVSEEKILALFEDKIIEIGGRAYKIVTIGSQQWMAENLDYVWDGLTVDYNQSGSWYNQRKTNYYADSKTTYGKYGRLYDWYAAEYLNNNLSVFIGSRLTRAGWHVPSSSDFDTLISEVGDRSTAGRYLKSVEINGTDDYQFNLRGNGMGIDSGGSIAYYRAEQWGELWAVDPSSSGNSAQVYNAKNDTDYFGPSSYDKRNVTGIRLVRNLA